jgi:motility quorum-sensing regulator/GCU-specific mRNA interferase toxin
MEKTTPHCKLKVVKDLMDAGRIQTTMSARRGAAELGFDFDGMLDVVRSLETTDFYKSMTTHDDHRVWQDVYRPMTHFGTVYLKLTVVDDVLVVSFKEQ